MDTIKIESLKTSINSRTLSLSDESIQVQIIESSRRKKYGCPKKCSCSVYKLRLPFSDFTDLNIYVSKSMVFWSLIHICLLGWVGCLIFSDIGNVKQVLQYQANYMTNEDFEKQYGPLTPVTNQSIKYDETHSQFGFYYQIIYQIDVCQIIEKKPGQILLTIFNTETVKIDKFDLKCQFDKETDTSTFQLNQNDASKIFDNFDEYQKPKYQIYLYNRIAKIICGQLYEVFGPQLNIRSSYGFTDIYINQNQRTVSKTNFLLWSNQFKSSYLCTQSVGIGTNEIKLEKKIMSKPFSFWSIFPYFNKNEYYLSLGIQGIDTLSNQQIYTDVSIAQQQNFGHLDSIITFKFNEPKLSVTDVKYKCFNECLSDFGGFHTSLLLISYIFVSNLFRRQMIQAMAQQIDPIYPKLVMENMKTRLSISNIYLRLGQVNELKESEELKRVLEKEHQDKLNQNDQQIQILRRRIQVMEDQNVKEREENVANKEQILALERKYTEENLALERKQNVEIEKLKAQFMQEIREKDSQINQIIMMLTKKDQ